MICPNCCAGVTAGSRFCNSCGGALPPGGPPSPTQTFHRPGQVPGQEPPPGRGAAAPFQPDVTQQYGIAPPPPPPQKRPIALLATLAVLLIAGVVTGSVLLVQGKLGRARNAVTGAQ